MDKLMKKLGALLLIICVAVTLSACSAFHDDSTTTYPQDEPMQATVFLQVADIVNFSPALLPEWKTKTLLKNQASVTDDPNAVKITDITFRDPIEADDPILDTYTVDLTLTNVPATTLQKIVRPFKIDYIQTVFNPITLLPESDNFTYVVGYTATRRHSAVNTDWVATQADGSYVYLWTTTEPIEFHDVYPNRPLYYLLVLVGAAVIGGVVYLISRYNDCKKSQKPL